MINILFITKLKNSLACGVTVSVTQLLNTICNYANVGWLDLNHFEMKDNPRIKQLGIRDWCSFKADIAVFEDPFVSIDFCRIAATLRRNNIPYIIVPHGCFAKKALRKKAVKKYVAIKTVFKRFLTGCVATQFLCKNEEKTSIAFSKSLIIPNGIPSNDNYYIRDSLKNMVFVGRKDVTHKGIDYLLEAIKSKHELLASKKIMLNIYGSIESQDDENYINDFINEYGLYDVVKNNGPVFGKEKEDAYNQADLFVLTSRYEGFPMSVLEAMSYALPVIITEGTNLCDIVDEARAGWVCKTDTNDIGMAIERAVCSANYPAYSENAKKLATQYLWEEVAQETIKKYLGIIENRGIL